MISKAIGLLSMGCILGLAGLYIVAALSAPLLPAVKAAPSGPVELSHDGLVNAIAPKLQEYAAYAKPEVLKHIENPVIRWGAGKAYPAAVREVPVFAREGVIYVSDEFGKFSVKDLLAYLEYHMASQVAAGVAYDPNAGRLIDEIRELQGRVETAERAVHEAEAKAAAAAPAETPAEPAPATKPSDAPADKPTPETGPKLSYDVKGRP